MRRNAKAANAAQRVAYLVAAGEYDQVCGLAIFAQRATAVTWAARWERAHGEFADCERVTSITELSFVAAGEASPDPAEVTR